MNGIELIAAERRRQIEVEGYSAAHDDEHIGGELAAAAVCYAAPEPVYRQLPEDALGRIVFVDPWPFNNVDESGRGYNDGDKRKELSGSLQPIHSGLLTHASRIDLLVKAGALIAAEIDRLQRRAQWEAEVGHG